MSMLLRNVKVKKAKVKKVMAEKLKAQKVNAEKVKVKVRQVRVGKAQGATVLDLLATTSLAQPQVTTQLEVTDIAYQAQTL